MEARDARGEGTRTDLKGEVSDEGTRSTRSMPLDVPAQNTVPHAEQSAQTTL